MTERKRFRSGFSISCLLIAALCVSFAAIRLQANPELSDAELADQDEFVSEARAKLGNDDASIYGKKTIRIPFDKVVAIISGNREILLIFSTHPEKDPVKLNRRIFEWYSIERITDKSYKLISEGSDDLYEGEYQRFPDKQDLPPPSPVVVDDKTILAIDDFRMPWSYSNSFEAGYLYYNAEEYRIVITNHNEFDDYLKGYEQIE